MSASAMRLPAPAAALLLLLLEGALALDDGLARTPPMGWRSWNTFGGDVDQQLMEDTMDLLVARGRTIDGVPTSLCDLGYCDVGLDDGWQQCGSYGRERYTFHQPNGMPVVNRSRFPNFEAMTAHAHALGLTAGWYLNNCICADHCGWSECYLGDAVALAEFEFDGVKLDGCSAAVDLDAYARALGGSGRPIVIENCHWGHTLPTEGWCPFHFYRTSTDILPTYASVVANLHTVVPLANANLSGPGCWAYPDMLELGCPNGPYPALSEAESRTHFGAWCIASSPLILSHDLRDAAVADALWPLISNREAIAINQAWAGHPGAPFDISPLTLLIEHGPVASALTSRPGPPHKPRTRTDLPVSAPQWEAWAKPLDPSAPRVAVLLINHARVEASLFLDFAKVPGLGCVPAPGPPGPPGPEPGPAPGPGPGPAPRPGPGPHPSPSSGCKVRMRDVWARKDMGTFSGGYTAKYVQGHDAAFFVLSREGGGAEPAPAAERGPVAGGRR